MKWAYDIYTGDDWGDGPAVETQYAFDTAHEALRAARATIARHGYPDEWTGVTVSHDDESLGEERDWTWTPQAPGRLYASSSGRPDIEVDP